MFLFNIISQCNLATINGVTHHGIKQLSKKSKGCILGSSWTCINASFQFHMSLQRKRALLVLLESDLCHILIKHVCNAVFLWPHLRAGRFKFYVKIEQLLYIARLMFQSITKQAKFNWYIFQIYLHFYALSDKVVRCVGETVWMLTRAGRK